VKFLFGKEEGAKLQQKKRLLCPPLPLSFFECDISPPSFFSGLKTVSFVSRPIFPKFESGENFLELAITNARNL